MILLAQTPKFTQSSSSESPSIDELMSGLRPLKPEVDLPVKSTLLSYEIIILAVVGIVLVAFLLKWVWKKFCYKKALVLEQEVLISLEELAGQNLESSDFIMKLSYVFRKYLEEKKLCSAVRQTTEEFFHFLRNSKELYDQQDKLKIFFKQCDFVKFAGENLAGAQRQELVDSVRCLVISIAQKEASNP